MTSAAVPASAGLTDAERVFARTRNHDGSFDPQVRDHATLRLVSPKTGAIWAMRASSWSATARSTVRAPCPRACHPPDRVVPRVVLEMQWRIVRPEPRGVAWPVRPARVRLVVGAVGRQGELRPSPRVVAVGGGRACTGFFYPGDRLLLRKGRARPGDVFALANRREPRRYLPPGARRPAAAREDPTHGRTTW